ncbi:unnamed protein product (macronuclear) [Paramecium tetraurelia]|uniref:Uncharacterized protein n=1 Tax=Paramecium tetraurelia TaxID=5888 RepID=A0DQX9_PARTE|nr:uncharacterized protein GSPATT00002847001 [Paramecium tetraurelia]CAK85446.1 unnamed protein product [Paramecium tetraurelia]|eukprot:XP_001452843.1 hypothetical protein (macronuclear) [Paramecium tetraurelia strain d4-2]
MSNMLSEQLKTQYKSKSVYWRQEKEKLLQTFQPRQNNSQSQQRSRTSERKSIIRNLVDSLYHQGTPEKNKSIYYHFQSQITQQQQQQQYQSSAKKQHTDELSLSTIINKYQKQVENCNQKQVVYDPIAEQIRESFQELKKRSVKKQEIQKCQSEQKIIENSAHKQNIFSRINQIREFIDQQLGTNADESNKDIKYESQYQSDVDQSSGNLRNKSVEFKQFLDQRVSVGRDSTSNRLNHRINKLRSIRSCSTLDVGIQVSLQEDNLVQINSQRQKQQQESYQQFNDQHNSQNYQQQNLDSSDNSRRKLEEQYEVQDTIQQTSPQQSQNPYYQVEQSVTSEYQLPFQQMLQQQYLNEDSLQKTKNSGRMSRRSEFLQKARYSTNVNDENKDKFQVNIEEIKKERLSENERFSVTSNEIGGKDGILSNLDFNKERFSVRSNEQYIQNKERNSFKYSGEEEYKDKLILKLNQPEIVSPVYFKSTLNNKENLENQFGFKLKYNNQEQENKQGEGFENKLNTIEIPKIIQALNFDNIELSKPCTGTQISVDTNRFQLEIQQIIERQNETQDVQLKQNEAITIQQDFALTSNRSQLSVPITEPTQIQQNNQINTNFIRVEEEIEAGQPDIRIIENATGITECNLQYSEDTANLRIPTQISNNEETKFKPDSYVTCEIQFQQIKQDYQQLNQLQSTQSNQMNQSSFEQWLSQTDQNKRIFNFNCQSQYFQKEKCDHSTQINKSDSDSDEEIQFIKKKQQKCLFNQGVTLLVRKITSILKIRQIKSFYEMKEYSLHQSQQQQQQLQQFKSSLHTYHSPIESQYSSQFYSQQQSLTSLPIPSSQIQQSQPDFVPQATKEQAAQEKISNLLKTIMEETGSDTLRMLKNKSNLSPIAKNSEKKRLNSSTNSKLRISKKCSAASILASMQSPVQEINDRIKVNFIQEMGLESPTQKHTEHAELHDCSPIAEPMEFQDVSVLIKQRREMKQIADSNNGSNIINNSYNDQRHCQILSHHIAIQKAKIAKKFQQIHYKTAGQQQFRKENYQI